MADVLTALPSQTAVTPAELEPGATAAAAAPAPVTAPGEAAAIAPAAGGLEGPGPVTLTVTPESLGGPGGTSEQLAAQSQGRPIRQLPTLQEPPQPPNSENIQRLIAENSWRGQEILARREPPPTPPQLHIELPKPPKFAPIPLVDNFSSIAAVVGVLGALRSRAPLTAALTGLAGAMNGMMQGNEDAYSKGIEQWKRESEVAIQENQLLSKQYEMARTAYKDRDDQLMDQWKSIAALNQDSIQIYNLQKGDYDAARQRVTDLNTSTLKLWEAQERLQEMDPKRFGWMDRQAQIRAEGREPTSQDALAFETEWSQHTKGQGRRTAATELQAARVAQGVNGIVRSVQIMGRMGISGGGMFSSVTNKSGDFTGAIRAQAARTLTSDEQVASEVAMGTVFQELAKIVSGGSLQPGVTQIQNYERKYAITPRDTLFTASFKLADIVAQAKAALEVTPAFSEQQKKDFERLLGVLDQYRTPEEILDMFGKNVTDYAREILMRGGELPEGVQAATGAAGGTAGGAAETPAQRFLRANPEVARIVNDPNKTEAQKREELKKLGLQ